MLRPTPSLQLGPLPRVFEMSGVGALGGAIFYGVGNWVVDEVSISAKTKTKEASAAFIKANKDDILAATGVSSLAELQEPSTDTEQLRIALSSVQGVKTFLDQQGDDATRELAIDVVVDALLTVSEETLDQVDLNTESIAAVETTLNGFIEESKTFRDEVTKTLDTHTKQLDNLTNDVAALQDAVSQTNETLEQHGQELSFLSDFAFSQMSPTEKARALERGFLSKRFEGKEDVRQKLITQYKSEARLQSRVKAFKGFATKLAGINQIAQNLGIESKELSTAVAYTSAASTAFEAFATGNWVGGLVAVTSLFGKKRDPDAERFKMLMGYLESQFKQVNAKLDALLEGQNKILEGLGQLSEQITQQNTIISQKLDALAFEVEIVRDLARMAAWRDWRACYLLYQEAHRPEPGSQYGGYKYPYRLKGDFDSIDQIINLARDTSSTRRCIEEAEQAFGSLSQTDIFENFMSLRFAVQSTPPVELSTVEKEDYQEAQSDLQDYIENHYEQIINLIDANRSQAGLNWSQLLALSSAPAHSFGERLPPSVRCLGHAGTAPTLRESAGIGMSLLLCGPRTSPADRDYNAITLLRTPTAHAPALEMADWILVAARTVDVWNHIDQRYYRDSDAFLNAVNDGQWSSRPSLKILEGMESVMSYVLATASVGYGVEAAEGVIAALKRQDEEGDNGQAQALREAAFKVISRDRYLAQNVVTKLLRDAYVGSGNAGDGASISDGKIPFQFSYDFAATSSERPVELLKKLFAQSAVFDIRYSEEQEFPQVCVGPVEADRICFLMPSFSALESGVLHYPDYVYEIAAKREKIRARIAEYSVFDRIETPTIDTATKNNLVVDLVRYGYRSSKLTNGRNYENKTSSLLELQLSF